MAPAARPDSPATGASACRSSCQPVHPPADRATRSCWFTHATAVTPGSCSIRLELVPTPTADVYAVQRQWPREGVWVLDLTVTEGDGHMTSLVLIGASGEVREVRGPTVQGRTIRPTTSADVNAVLRSLSAG